VTRRNGGRSVSAVACRDCGAGPAHDELFHDRDRDTVLQ
jgi:hypothetical protein